MMRDRMIFAAILVLLFALFFSTKEWFWLGLLLIWLVRIRFLENDVQKTIYLILIISLFIMLFHHSNQVTIKESATYRIVLDPYHLSVKESMLTGEASLIQEGRMIPITLIDWQFEGEQLKEAEIWEVKGEVSLPSKARNFGVLDYQNYLKTIGIDYQLEIKAIEKREKQVGLKADLINWRHHFLQHFSRLDSINLFSIYNRLIWNLDSSAYRTNREEMIQLGIIHFFALSGLHVSLLMKYLDYFMRRIGVVNEIARIIQYSLLVLYAFLTGFPIGVIRAAGMRLLKDIAHYRAIDALSIIMILLLWWHPYFSLNTGFQLSFFSTIILCFFEVEEGQPSFQQQIRLAISCLLCSWAIILPQSHIWYPFQLIGGLVFGYLFNVLILPFTVLMTIASFLIGSSDGQVLNSINFSSILSLFKPFSFGIVIGEINLIWCMGLFGCVYLWMNNWKQSFKWIIPYYLALTLIGGHFFNEQLTVIDVGQGDALIYQPRFSHGGWMIDTGGKAKFNADNPLLDNHHAKRTLVPALRALGVRYLDGIILTHADFDHIGNLSGLLEALSIKTLIINQRTSKDDYFRSVIAEQRTPPQIWVLRENEYVNLAPLPIEIWAGVDSSDKNEGSLVSRIFLGNLRILNMGDASTDSEANFQKGKMDMQAEILKVGHHGSNSSSSEAWLEYIRPNIAIISAGVNNRYGHPDPQIIERLIRRNLMIFQTNKHGAIQIVNPLFLGEKIRVALPN